MDPRDNLSAICLDFLLSLAFDAVKINRGRGYMMEFSLLCCLVGIKIYSNSCDETRYKLFRVTVVGRVFLHVFSFLSATAWV